MNLARLNVRSFFQEAGVSNSPRGSAILIQDNGSRGFILQYKDHKYSLFGGMEQAGENPEQTLERALKEAWSDQFLVVDIMRVALACSPMVLPLRETAGSYILHPYVATASSIEQFKDWLTILLDPDAVLVGKGLYRSLQAMVEELQPPEKFLAGLEIPFQRHLKMLTQGNQPRIE